MEMNHGMRIVSAPVQTTAQVNGVLLRYDDLWRPDKKDDCFRRASYLAKTNTKGSSPKGQRELFSSRIPQKQT